MNEILQNSSRDIISLPKRHIAFPINLALDFVSKLSIIEINFSPTSVDICRLQAYL